MLNKKRISLFMALMILITSCIIYVVKADINIYNTLKRKPGDLYIKFLNVGNGDAIYIELPNGDDVLIDGGEYIEGDKVVEFLETQNLDEGDGINDIEYVINTHPHSDHVGGLVKVFEEFTVNNFYYPNDFDMKYYEGFEGSEDIEDGHLINCMNYCNMFYQKVLQLAKEQGTVMNDTVSGTYIDESRILKFVHPDKTYKQDTLDNTDGIVNSYDYCRLNNDSAVIYLDYNELQVLLTGDIESEVEEDIMQLGLIQEDSVDILKLSHHGFDGTTTNEFLNYINPQIAVISRAEENERYTTPVKNLMEANVTIKETWKRNGVEVVASDNGWTIK